MSFLVQLQRQAAFLSAADNINITGQFEVAGRLDATTDTGSIYTRVNSSNDAGSMDLDAAINADLDGILTANGAIEIAARAGDLITRASNEIVANSITLTGKNNVDLSGDIAAQTALKATAQTGNLTTQSTAALNGKTIELTGQVNVTLDGEIVATDNIDATASTGILATKTTADMRSKSIDLTAKTLDLDGKVASSETLALVADNITNKGEVTSQTITLDVLQTINNEGLVSAGQSLIAKAGNRITNTNILLSGDDIALYANELVNDGGVIWANDSVTIAKNEALEFASLILNKEGKIEAFQGDVVLRATDVENIGLAPTIKEGKITKSTESATAPPVVANDEIIKLIDPAFLNADGSAVKPEYLAAYLALWAGVIEGGDALSSEASAIVKSSLLNGVGTGLDPDFFGVWVGMNARADEEGVGDVPALVKSMLDSSVFKPTGEVKEEHLAAYAQLWEGLADGKDTVCDDVKAILKESVLKTQDDGAGGTVITNTLKTDYTDVWHEMADASSGASYDIIKILYQDVFNDDGRLAEIKAGGTVDIAATNLKNWLRKYFRRRQC